jgi:hypothetical protein
VLSSWILLLKPASWTKEKQENEFGSYFFRYENPVAQSPVQSRVYVNAKSNWTYYVFKAIIDLGCPIQELPSQTGETPNALDRALKIHPGKEPIKTIWTYKVPLSKIADIQEVFRGRRDLIVVYLNEALGEAINFAKQLSARIKIEEVRLGKANPKKPKEAWLNNDVMRR